MFCLMKNGMLSITGEGVHVHFRSNAATDEVNIWLTAIAIVFCRRH